jgi:hypothetical protein
VDEAAADLSRKAAWLEFRIYSSCKNLFVIFRKEVAFLFDIVPTQARVVLFNKTTRK